MRAVSGATRNVRTSPPMGMTCATPGIDSKRGRSTKSAYSRACIGVAAGVLPSLGTSGKATSMISPMMDETGPITGVMSPGICVRTSASLSATN